MWQEEMYGLFKEDLEKGRRLDFSEIQQLDDGYKQVYS